MTSRETRATPGQFPGPIGDDYLLAATAATTWAAGAVTIHRTYSSVLPTTSAVRLPDSPGSPCGTWTRNRMRSRETWPMTWHWSPWYLNHVPGVTACLSYATAGRPRRAFEGRIGGLVRLRARFSR